MRMINSLKDNFKYRPVKIEFAGLYGDTQTMSQRGWELNLECYRSPHNDSFTLVIAGVNRPLDLRIMSARVDISSSYIYRANSPIEFLDGICTRIDCCARNIIMRQSSISENIKSVNWNGMIGIAEMSSIKEFSIDEVFHFPTKDQTIFIPESKIWTIEEHLNAIRKAQEPFQDDLLRMNEFKKTENTKLKLIGVA